MDTSSKVRIKAVIAKDILDIHNRFYEVKRSIQDNLQDVLDYFHELHAQIPESTSGPLIAKTPKHPGRKEVQRIETIPEDIAVDNTISDSIMTHNHVKKQTTEKVKVGRSKREASIKAADIIKKQQSSMLNSPKRRSKQDANAIKKNRGSRDKRKQLAVNSSDEENSGESIKRSRIDETITETNVTKKSMELDTHKDRTSPEQNKSPEENGNATMTIRRSNRKISSEKIENTNSKQGFIIGNAMINGITDDVEETSMYEDAIGKPTPIMSSTMNCNSTMVIQKMMDATVVLEPLSSMKVNETITIKKKSSSSSSNEARNRKHTSPKENGFKLPRVDCLPKTGPSPSRALHDRKINQVKEAMTNAEFEELLTDDESSPEVERSLYNGKKQEDGKKYKRILYSSSSSSEDEVPCTPAKRVVRGVNNGTMTVQDIRNTFKSNALFSPYAKESVKKRVEAFEQVRMNSPKPTIDTDAPTRVTRTKTRAIAAAARAEAAENVPVEKTLAQKLARKSLAKAKKISLAKQQKETDDKENKMQVPQKTQKQLKTTPLGKTRTQLPMSVNRIARTPANGHYNANSNQALSATRTNIITSVDSFLQGSKTTNKPNTTERTEEKKRKLNDEDAKRKREEALRLQTEEKKRKRQEKELKIKMAREAKEKQDMEKRQKLEKEREEKARLAQQMQDKQREEMEKKRLAQIQRAHMKEEKRKQEEQQRLQRLAEQEEMERVLAEQRRREQEAEKRKEAEARAQHQAAIEALRIKNQMIQANAKHGKNKNQDPTNYALDSEPDDDESDDESRPKHAIPIWAQPQVRKAHLSMQRYIPQLAVHRFFGSRKCTPDLTQLFQGIDRSRLKRTSSAIWKTPPRYSMMEAE